jgi:hypothetical protein
VAERFAHDSKAAIARRRNGMPVMANLRDRRDRGGVYRDPKQACDRHIARALSRSSVPTIYGSTLAKGRACLPPRSKDIDHVPSGGWTGSPRISEALLESRERSKRAAMIEAQRRSTAPELDSEIYFSRSRQSILKDIAKMIDFCGSQRHNIGADRVKA